MCDIYGENITLWFNLYMLNGDYIMTSLRYLITLLLISLFFVVSCSNSKPNDSEFILIGTQGPLTGPVDNFGIQALGGIQLAVDEINSAGGINGRQVKLVSLDSRGEQKESLIGSNLLVTSGVCAVIGEPTSSAFLSSRSAYARHMIPVISPGATAVGVTDGLDYVFRTTLQDSIGAPYLADYLIDVKKYNNYVIITNTADSYSVSLSAFFRKRLKERNANIVGEGNIYGAATDVSAEIRKLRSKDIDVVIYTGYSKEAAVIINEIDKQSIDVIMAGAVGFQQDVFAPLVGDLAIGTIYYAGFSPNTNNELVKRFNMLALQKNIKSDMFAAQGYDTANIIFSVMKKVNTTNCDKESRVKIKSGLAKVKDYPGVAGMLSFDKEGSAIKVPFISEIYKAGNGTYSTRVTE